MVMKRTIAMMKKTLKKRTIACRNLAMRKKTLVKRGKFEVSLRF